MNPIRKILWRIRKTGVLQTLLWLQSHFSTWYREWSRGIDTRGRLPLDAEADNGCNGYEPIMYECLDGIFRHLEVTGSDVLVDYGSGKGRVLIEAATYPYMRIEGVEYEKSLIDDCLNNFRAFRADLIDHRVKIHHCDARDFEIPADATHLFIWNSFIGPVLQAVIDRVRAHTKAVDHVVHLIVALPSGETESLAVYREFGDPEIVTARFWTGADIYHYQVNRKSRD
ncbi:MAG: hypothetical protein AAF456_00260 [Planctomycetota bacterium]